MKKTFIILISSFLAACNTSNSNNNDNQLIVPHTKNPSQMSDAQLKNYKGKVQIACSRMCPKVEFVNNEWEVKEIAPEAFIDSFSENGRCLKTLTIDDYHTANEKIASVIIYDEQANRFNFVVANKPIGYNTDTFISANTRKTTWQWHVRGFNSIQINYDSFSNNLNTHYTTTINYIDGKLDDSSVSISTIKRDTTFEENYDKGKYEQSLQVILQRDSIGNPVMILNKTKTGRNMITLCTYTYYK